MKSRRRPLIGVIVDGVTDYGRSVLRGVLSFANLERRWVLHEDIWRVTGTMAHWPDCDGVIVAGMGRPVLKFVTDRCKNVIVCSGSIDPKEMPVVCMDDDAAGAMAAEHLMNCRLTNFGFYGSVDSQPVARRRLVGFQRALEQRGFSCDICAAGWPSSEQLLTHEHRPQLIDWLKTLPKPAGVMAVDDLAAHDLAGACHEANIGVPDHVAIIGVNNDDLLCEGAWPPLSSVDGDYARMGFAAARLMERLLAGEQLKEGERLVCLPPVGVVQRVSTNVLAVDEPDLADAIRYIREHACDPCTVHEVLRHVPVGRRWLERKFSEKLGRSPHDEITRVRIETACRLLHRPEMSISDIAPRCGFSQIQNFTRVFRDAMGKTPAAYRKALRHREGGATPRAAR